MSYDPRTAALAALTQFVSKFSPAIMNNANTFYTTTEIRKAIAELTGVALEPTEIFELLSQMGYLYEAMNGLEFNWLFKK
jgi:hypothetical protein